MLFLVQITLRIECPSGVFTSFMRRWYHESGVSIAITFASLLLYVIRVGFWTTAVSSDSASRIT